MHQNSMYMHKTLNIKFALTHAHALWNCHAKAYN